MKRRIFISSVQREFSRERKLLKKFIEASSHEVYLTIFRKQATTRLNKLPNKLPNKTDILTEEQMRLIKLIAKDTNASAQKLARQMSVSSRTIRTQVARLKELGVLQRIGSNKTGHWQILEGCEP